MKKFMLPIGGSLITTLALMLMTIAACENDDEPKQVVTDPFLVFNTGHDLNVVVGKVVTLNPVTPGGESPETSWAWEVLASPENSQSVLLEGEQATAVFQADVAGKYELELTGSVGHKIDRDTLVIYAYSVQNLTGTYQMQFSSDGEINRLYQYQDQLYATGTFSHIGENVKAAGIAYYDGTGWSPLGSGLQQDFDSEYGGLIHDIIEYKGELYITGFFANPGGVESIGIARWDGNNWKPVPGLGSSPWYDGGNALEVFNDELYIAGEFTSRSLSPDVDYSLVKWDGDQLTGVLTPFYQINDLEIYQDRLYGVGREPAVASFDGTDWETLHDAHIGGNAVVFKDNLFINIEIWYVDEFFGIKQPYVASTEIMSWNGTLFQDFGKAFSLNSYKAYSGHPYYGNLIDEFEVAGNILYIGGIFNDEVVGTSSNGLVTWDGQNWGVVPDGHSATIKSMQQFHDKLFIAGSFDGSSTSQIVIWQPN